MTMARSLICFLALLATVSACAPLTPGVGNNPTKPEVPNNNNNNAARIAELEAEIKKLTETVKQAEPDVETQEAALAELEIRSQLAEQLIPTTKRDKALSASEKERLLKKSEKVVTTFKDAKEKLDKTKKEISENKRKLEALKAEKKVLEYGKLSAEDFDKKLQEVEKKLADSKAKLVTDKEAVPAKETEIEELKKSNRNVFEVLIGYSTLLVNFEAAKNYQKVKTQEAHDLILIESALNASEAELDTEIATAKQTLETTKKDNKEVVDQHEAKLKELKVARTTVVETEITIYSSEVELQTLKKEKSAGK